MGYEGCKSIEKKLYLNIAKYIDDIEKDAIYLWKRIFVKK